MYLQNDHFDYFNDESKREMSTTMVFVRLITSLLRDKNIGKNIVSLCLMKLEHLVWMAYFDNLAFIVERVKNISLKMLIKSCGIESQKMG